MRPESASRSWGCKLMSGRRLTLGEIDLIGQLHRSGIGPSEIARRVGCNLKSVQYRLNLHDERSRAAAGIRRRRLNQRGNVLPRPPVGRTIAKTIASPETKMAAIREFASGNISREELMKRISRNGDA